MNGLQHHNQALFFRIYIDGGYHYHRLGAFVLFKSDSRIGIVAFLPDALLLIRRDCSLARHVILLPGLACAMTDWTGEQLKPWLASGRPCQSRGHVRLPVDGCGGGLPSSHALNTAMVTTFLGPRYSVLLSHLVLLLVLVGIARTNVGVDDPGDVIVCWLPGRVPDAAAGWLAEKTVCGWWWNPNRESQE